MDRTLWKLERTGERLWLMATLIAAHAASLENEGKGLAVVAEESRRTGELIGGMVEKALKEGTEPDRAAAIDLAHRLNLLAFNGAIEASRIIGFTGRQAAIYADEIRGLADTLLCLFDRQRAAEKRRLAAPWAADPSCTAQTGEFLLLSAGGMYFTEPLSNIQEVCVGRADEDGCIRLRGMRLPRIDPCRHLHQQPDGRPESRTHIILRAPWTKEGGAVQNRAYAVVAEAVCIFFSPIGRPAAAPAGMPLAAYVRECWENENGEPFYFMDWARMA